MVTLELESETGLEVQSRLGYEMWEKEKEEEEGGKDSGGNRKHKPRILVLLHPTCSHPSPSLCQPSPQNSQQFLSWASCFPRQQDLLKMWPHHSSSERSLWRPSTTNRWTGCMGSVSGWVAHVLPDVRHDSEISSPYPPWAYEATRHNGSVVTMKRGLGRSPGTPLWMGRGEGLVVKSTRYSYRGWKFNSQHPHHAVHNSL